MPSAFILCAGIAETDDKPDGRHELISPRRRLRHRQTPMLRIRPGIAISLTVDRFFDFFLVLFRASRRY